MLLLSSSVHAQLSTPLYDDQVPNSTLYHAREIWTRDDRNMLKEVSNVMIPMMTVFQPLPEYTNGIGVIIIPGGGYFYEKFDKEGASIADCFARHGITAFVLKYRLPSDSTMIDKRFGPIEDGQRAVQFVRQYAASYLVDTGKIGIMGFSAGGHLAAMVGTQFDTAYISNPLHINLRPDFMILVYPVISMTDSLTHLGTRRRLLGVAPAAACVAQFSDELHVTPQTPPTWITHAADDTTVTVRNSIVFYDALLAKHVPAEIHLEEKGGHEFVLNMPVDAWMGSVFKWMNGVVKR